ncbi:hypothetical protein EIN_016480 [Entamoeba invadens IP1]|uniref:hypothetical protein n=1 Tax=Entamoeba invadens IP1 TaxID=370355 RepID=UPI0002C3F469|nr:hypothetical protein EIN_016480 [Entamoeba invadens IP1]ELP90429.1 hypothetical protein EIN_016480 [Entamoeba invadens IP1]|eukprot:XP_004257200.1 hypothetical protein EIN_016480 [Entamoeba invadens IP1]
MSAHAITEPCLSLFVKYVSEAAPLKKLRYVSKKYNTVLNGLTETHRNKFPSPVHFKNCTHFSAQLRYIVKYAHLYKPNTTFDIFISDEIDLKALPTAEGKQVISQATSLVLECFEEFDLKYFVDLPLEKLVIDSSLFTYSKTAVDVKLVDHLFQPTLKTVVFDNTMLDNKLIINIIAYLAKHNPTTRVIINVVVFDALLSQIDNLKKVNPNVCLFIKFDVFIPYSKCTSRAIADGNVYVHPSNLYKPIKTVACQYEADIFAKIIQLYAFNNVILTSAKRCSAYPNARFEHLQIDGRMPKAFYKTEAIGGLKKVEYLEKTKKSPTLEMYDFSKCTNLVDLRVGNDAFFSGKKRVVTLPNTLTDLYWRQDFGPIGKELTIVEKNDEKGTITQTNGFASLTRLEYARFEPVDCKFDDVDFPQSLRSLNLIGVPHFEDMSKFDRLTNITLLAIYGCNQLVHTKFPPNLIELSISYASNIADLDLTSLTRLTSVDVAQYQGTTFKCGKNVKKLNFSHDGRIEVLDVSDANLDSIIVDTCDKLKCVKVPECVKELQLKDLAAYQTLDLSYVKSMDMLVTDYLNEMTSFVPPMTLKSCTIIGSNKLSFINLKTVNGFEAFTCSWCDKLVEVALPPSTKTIDIEDDVSLARLNTCEMNPKCKTSVANCPLLK